MVDSVDSVNSKAAFDLLKAGDADGLRRFLEENSDAAEAVDGNGVSLLMHCMYRGLRDLAAVIGRKKTTVDIYEAASLGDKDALKRFAGQPQDVNSHSKDGFTALHFACFFGQPDAAKWLITNGAAVHTVAANPTSVMALHSAASARNLEAARALLENGAPVNARQQAGWAPIHSAAQNGDRAMVELLLQHGGDPTAANDQGKTPAAVAREAGHPEIAALLLEKTS